MYVESSSPARMGDNAILRSPWLSTKQPSCVSFAYHMHGTHMGTFRMYAFEKLWVESLTWNLCENVTFLVFCSKNAKFGNSVMLWEKEGDQGRKWQTSPTIIYKPSSDKVEVSFWSRHKKNPVWVYTTEKTSF